MSVRICLAAVCLAVGAFAWGAQNKPAAKDEKSPHAAALELVFQTQQARIREVDAGEWWHDTKERTWTARRPFAPGLIDSTHLFEVAYRIDGKPAAAWLVDTRTGKVDERK